MTSVQAKLRELADTRKAFEETAARLDAEMKEAETRLRQNREAREQAKIDGIGR